MSERTASPPSEQDLDGPRDAVTVGEYTWADYRAEYGDASDAESESTAGGFFDRSGPSGTAAPAATLGFDPADIGAVIAEATRRGERAAALVDQRSVTVTPELDEDAFFRTEAGEPTLVDRYDLEKTVPMAKKRHFTEVERYWVDKPYAFVVIFHSQRENEKKYYVVDPYLNDIETRLVEYLAGKLRTAITYSDEDIVVEGMDADRRAVIETKVSQFIDRYNLRESDSGGLIARLRRSLTRSEDAVGADDTAGGTTRPEPAVIAEDAGTLSESQIETLLYELKRDFVGYERVDPIKHDINVEDISCDGYDAPVFVYHTDYEQLITNVSHGTDELDDFVVKLAQRSGKGISKRQPQVDTTLPDGSRAQLTLGREVSDHGTNYTIRQFKDIPFTPVDLINWHTFSLDEMAFLWLCIENNKSLVFAGGTASGKTTSLNAVSLFIPSNSKIVSIEDTREVELPQRNWVASVTRPSFTQDGTGDISEFELLEAALRQRPDYIVMGEVRGEEGRTLFQVMSTGHTTYTTFHADSVGEVIKRFTTDPINVSKTLFTALDLVSVQTQTRIRGRKVRRNKTLTEITDYDSENDEISVQDVFQWEPESDTFRELGPSSKLDEIAFDRGWSDQRLETELFKRRTILAYLIHNGLNDYAQVAATVQAFIKDPETVLTLVANGQLKASLENLKSMESVVIDVDEHKEESVPRPEPTDAVREETERILDRAAETLLAEYRGTQPDSLVSTLASVGRDGELIVAPTDGERAIGALGADADGAATDGGRTRIEGGEDESRDE
ncbi:type II/IV secretion system ATPase subunit [Haloarcula pelagica]|uniref:type II/IV secretion system ATPase subunit n=1 Tax=Haloarcula pelagica TaxID=3033389 RepID=UPI0024C44747|nr:type II/IV secretion system ATPase subunit [Halomicroarcula sp. YJ-61-S]